MAGGVFFDPDSAVRIANAVRKVEIGDRSERPLTFDTVSPQQQRKVFRIATFTGAWSVNSSKTVTFKFQTSTPNTANAINLFFPVVGTAAGNRDCAIAKDGTAWYLIDVRFYTATAVFVGATQSQTVISAASTNSLTVMTAGSTSRITYAGAGATQTFLTAVAASLNTSNCTITVSTTNATVAIAGSTQTATIISNASTQTVTVMSSVATQSIAVLTSTYTAAFLRLEA